VNQAMKALAVANRHLASTGVQLAAYPGLVNETVENRDGEPHLWVIVILKLVEVRL
jgi:stage V sporulation protein SpoVS